MMFLDITSSTGRNYLRVTFGFRNIRPKVSVDPAYHIFIGMNSIRMWFEVIPKLGHDHPYEQMMPPPIRDSNHICEYTPLNLWLKANGLRRSIQSLVEIITLTPGYWTVVLFLQISHNFGRKTHLSRAFLNDKLDKVYMLFCYAYFRTRYLPFYLCARYGPVLFYFFLDKSRSFTV